MKKFFTLLALFYVITYSYSQIEVNKYMSMELGLIKLDLEMKNNEDLITISELLLDFMTQEIEDDVNGIMDKILNSAKIKIAVLNPVDASGYSSYDKINSLVNQVRTELSKNKFVTLISLSRYESTYYSNDFSDTGAEIVIKFTFNSWGEQTSRNYIEGYSNSAEREKKDGTIQKFYVSGSKYKYNYVCNFNAMVEAIKTNDNVLLLSEPLTYDIRSTVYQSSLDQCYLIGVGDSYANSSGCSLYKNMPNPKSSTEKLFRDNFLSLTSRTMQKWFD